jgi:hypothetical protein
MRPLRQPVKTKTWKAPNRRQKNTQRISGPRATMQRRKSHSTSHLRALKRRITKKWTTIKEMMRSSLTIRPAGKRRML